MNLGDPTSIQNDKNTTPLNALGNYLFSSAAHTFNIICPILLPASCKPTHFASPMTSLLPERITLVLRHKQHGTFTTAQNQLCPGTRKLLIPRMNVSIANDDVKPFCAYLPLGYPFMLFFCLRHILAHLTTRPLHAVAIPTFRLLSLYPTAHATGTALKTKQFPSSHY